MVGGEQGHPSLARRWPQLSSKASKCSWLTVSTTRAASRMSASLCSMPPHASRRMIYARASAGAHRPAAAASSQQRPARPRRKACARRAHLAPERGVYHEARARGLDAGQQRQLAAVVHAHGTEAHLWPKAVHRTGRAQKSQHNRRRSTSTRTSSFFTSTRSLHEYT